MFLWQLRSKWYVMEDLPFSYFDTAGNLLISFYQKAAGACNFILCFPIWYIFVAQMLESIDFPLVLPVGDLSEVVQRRNQKARKRVENEE
jgi:hypothetical protein